MTKKIVKNKKIDTVILMHRYHVGANIVLNKIVTDPNINIKALIIKDVWSSKKHFTGHNMLFSFYRFGRKIGFYCLLGFILISVLHFIPLIIFDLLFLGVVYKSRNFLKTSESLAKFYNIPVHIVSDINDKESTRLLKSLKPDVILSNNYGQIIKDHIINIPKIACINLHPGILPTYKGLMPHFWNMVNKDTEGGVTLHLIDEGVDTGRIILMDKITIEKGTSYYKHWFNLAILGSKLLKKYFKSLRQGKSLNTKIQYSKDKIFHLPFPTSSAFIRFKQNGYKLFKFSDFFK